MGNFYANHTVRAPQERVVAFLEEEGRTAFVGPTSNGYTVVCDRRCDEQDPAAILDLGRKLSASLGPVLAVLNHDDDLLCYWLFEEGKLVEEYNSCPDYFDEDEDEEEELNGFGIFSGEDEDEEEEDEEGAGPANAGEELCRVLGAPAGRVRSVLARAGTFAVELHERLVRALGLPEGAVGSGYRYVAQGDAGLARAQCVHVGRQAAGRR